MNKLLIVGIVSVICVTGLIGYNISQNDISEELGSVSQEYNYTHYSGSGIASTTLLKTGWGTFGSVIVTEDQAGAVFIYDATSTAAVTDGPSALYDVMATFENAQLEGVYTFDVIFSRGLVFSANGQTFAGNWTITWR